MSAFFQQFITVFQGVGQIGLIIVVAGWLTRRGIIPKAGVKLLSDSVIALFLPCLIFSNIVERFQPAQTPGWWVMPLAAALLIFSGWALATLVFARARDAKRELMPMGFLQNAAYFVLPVANAILDEGFETFSVYIFLFLLGNNPLLWLIGKHFFYKRESGEPFRWRQILSPPIYANIVALAIVAAQIQSWVPPFVLKTTSFIGDAAVPMATLALGATLGSLTLNFHRHLRRGSLVILQKMFLMPILVLGAMALIPWLRSSELLILFFILQGASPPATSIVLQSKSYSDDSERVGTTMILCYIVCIFSIPIWVSIAQALFR